MSDSKFTLRGADIPSRDNTMARSSLLPRASASLLLVLFFALLVLTACTAPVRVEWRTETELNTVGFNLYRGTSPDGPFDVKVNDQLIPPAADPLTGKSYTYLDNTAQVGVTYYYQLQEVERSGQVNTHGPISVRAGGLTWWHLTILALLGSAVLFVWLRGGKLVKLGPPPGG